jgi:hypothetical protein
MKSCGACGQELADQARFCIRCGRYVYGEEPRAARPVTTPEPQIPPSRAAETMNVTVLYVMIAGLALAALFPPWEDAPGQPPRFLGFHFLFAPPEPDAVVSRMLIMIELTTIAVAGFYLSWFFRNKP